ncbi:contractile injection system tape measure protein [Vicingaceae bacterium]|nr:contractile injection system tape measure protein [Vicingaceae bacterium]
MKNGAHLINRTTIDVTTNKGPAQFDSFETFKQLFYGKLLDIIDKELSQYQDKSIIKIDQLEIDLGEFNVSSDQHFSVHELNEIQDKFRVTFNQQLKASLTKTNSKKSYLDLLKEFLMSGNTSSDYLLGEISPADILKQLSKKEIDSLSAFIVKNGTNKNLLKRLIYQFSLEEIKPLIKVLIPNYTPYSLDVVKFHSAFKKNIKGVSQLEFEERFLVYLLHNFIGKQVVNPEKETLIQDFISYSMEVSEMSVSKKELIRFFNANPQELDQNETVQEDGDESLIKIKFNDKYFSNKEDEFDFLLSYLITEGSLPEEYFKLTKDDFFELLVSTISKNVSKFKGQFKNHTNVFYDLINKLNISQRKRVLNKLNVNYLKERERIIVVLNRLVKGGIIHPDSVIEIDGLIDQVSLFYLLNNEHNEFSFTEKILAEILKSTQLKLTNTVLQPLEATSKGVLDVLSMNYLKEKSKFLKVLDGLISAKIIQPNSILKLDKLIDEVSFPLLLLSTNSSFKFDEKLIAEILKKNPLKNVEGKPTNTKQVIETLLKQFVSNKGNNVLELLSENYIKEKKRFLAQLESLVKTGIVDSNTVLTIDSLIDEISLPILLTAPKSSFKFDKKLIAEILHKHPLKLVGKNSSDTKPLIDNLLKKLLLNESNNDLELLSIHYLKEKKRFLDQLESLVKSKLIHTHSFVKIEALIDEMSLPLLINSKGSNFKFDKKLTAKIVQKSRIELIARNEETLNSKTNSLDKESSELLRIVKTVNKDYSALVYEDDNELIPKSVNLSETFIENLILYIFQNEKLPWWGTQEVSTIYSEEIVLKEDQSTLMFDLLQHLKGKSTSKFNKVVRQLLSSAKIRNTIIWSENEALPSLLINTILPTFYNLPIYSFFNPLDEFLANFIGKEYKIDKLFHQISDILIPNFLKTEKLDIKEVYSSYLYAYSLALKISIEDLIKIIQSNRIDFNLLIDLKPDQIELVLKSVNRNISHQEELLNNVFSLEEMSAIHAISVSKKEIEQAAELLMAKGFLLKDAVLLERQFFTYISELEQNEEEGILAKPLTTLNEVGYQEVLALYLRLKNQELVPPSNNWKDFVTENVQQIDILKAQENLIDSDQLIYTLIQNFITEYPHSEEPLSGLFEQKIIEKIECIKLAIVIQKKRVSNRIEVDFASQYLIETLTALKDKTINISDITRFSKVTEELIHNENSEEYLEQINELTVPLKLKKLLKKLGISKSSTFEDIQMESVLEELHKNDLALNSKELKTAEKLFSNLTTENIASFTEYLNFKVIDTESLVLNELLNQSKFNVFFDKLITYKTAWDRDKQEGGALLNESLSLMNIEGIDAKASQFYFEQQKESDVERKEEDKLTLNKVQVFIEAVELKPKPDIKVEYYELIEQLLDDAQFIDNDEKLIVETLLELSFDAIEEKEVVTRFAEEIAETIVVAEEEVLDDRLKFHKESIDVLLRSLEHFFIHGALPWWSPYASTVDFQNYFNRLYNNNRVEIYTLIKETFSEKEVYNYLSEYIDSYGIEKVFENERIVLERNLVNSLNIELNTVVSDEIKPQIDWLIESVLYLNRSLINEGLATKINSSIIQYAYRFLSTKEQLNEDSLLSHLDDYKDEKSPYLEQYSKSAFESVQTVQKNIENNYENFQAFNIEFKQLLQSEFPEKETTYWSTFQELIAQEVLEVNFEEKTISKVLVGFTYYLGLMEQTTPKGMVLKLIRNAALTDLNLYNTLLNISDSESFDVIQSEEKGFLLLIELLSLQDSTSYESKHINKLNIIELSTALKGIDSKNWSHQLFALILLEKANELKITVKEALITFSNSINELSDSEFSQLNERIELLKELGDDIEEVEDSYKTKLIALSSTQKKLETAQPHENLLAAVIKELRYNTKFLEDYQDNKVNELWNPIEKEEEKDIKHDWIDIKEGDRIFVANAGVILLWPFLKTLFNNLNYLEKGLFKDRDTQERAIHILQYIVDGEEKTPEFILMLNKVMCGVPVSDPIKINIKLTDEEKEEAEHFLDTVKNQWKEMKNTSIDIFRDTFLKREGAIYYENEKWFLKVEHKPIDILLTKLPWGLSMIKFSWVKYRILVEWNAKN